MGRAFHTSCAAVVLFAAAGPALWAAQESGAVDARAVLSIHLEHGNVQVRGQSSQKQVKWSTQPHTHRLLPGKKHEGGDEVQVRTSRDEVHISSEGAADLFIEVPESIAFADIHTEQGDVLIANINGHARVHSDGGKIELDQVRGASEVGTGGGNITAKHSGGGRFETGGGNVIVDASGGDVRAVTGGGNITVTAAKGSVREETGGGNLVLQQADGDAVLQTGGGNIDMGDLGGQVMAETASGNIRLASARGFVHVRTHSGTIECHQLGSGVIAESESGRIWAQFAKDARLARSSSLMTASGDIAVYLPDRLNATVRTEVKSPWGHSIHSEFQELPVRQSENGVTAAGNLGGGGPPLHVETDSGNVQLMRAH